jgi:hypothetical protein
MIVAPGGAVRCAAPSGAKSKGERWAGRAHARPCPLDRDQPAEGCALAEA